MTNQPSLLVDYKEFDQPELVKLGDGHSVEAVGHGNVQLEMLFGVSHSKPAKLTRVLSPSSHATYFQYELL